MFVGNLRPDETVDADHEAKLLRNLNHAGIVRFYDSFVEAEFFCIVTEFCDVSRDLLGLQESSQSTLWYFVDTSNCY